MMLTNNPQDFINHLRADLLEARKVRDQLTTATLQAVISAIDNAGAVPIPESIDSIGVGSTEAARRDLSEQDVREIINLEIAELQYAVNKLDGAQGLYVDELNKKIAILKRYL